MSHLITRINQMKTHKIPKGVACMHSVTKINYIKYLACIYNTQVTFVLNNFIKILL